MKATLTVDSDARLIELFKPEDKQFPRGSYNIEQAEDAIVFTANANDATAMRAILSAILKNLQIWEGAKQL